MSDELRDPILDVIEDVLKRYAVQYKLELTPEEKRRLGMFFISGCLRGSGDLFTVLCRRFDGASAGMIQDQLQLINRYASLSDAFLPREMRDDN